MFVLNGRLRNKHFLVFLLKLIAGLVLDNQKAEIYTASKALVKHQRQRAKPQNSSRSFQWRKYLSFFCAFQILMRILLLLRQAIGIKLTINPLKSHNSVKNLRNFYWFTRLGSRITSFWAGNPSDFSTVKFITANLKHWWATRNSHSSKYWMISWYKYWQK